MTLDVTNSARRRGAALPSRSRRHPGQQCRHREEQRQGRGHQRRALAPPHGGEPQRRLLVLPLLGQGQCWSAGKGSIVNIGSMSAVHRQQAPAPVLLQRLQGSRAPPHQIARLRVGPARRAGERGGTDLYRDAAHQVRHGRPEHVPDLDGDDAHGPRRPAGGDRLHRALPRRDASSLLTGSIVLADAGYTCW